MDLALFDFDGTITTRETFADFIRFVVTPSRQRLGAVLFAARFVGYKLGWVSGNDIRARLVRFALRGMPAATATAAGERFSSEILETLLRPEAMTRLQWHRERGDTIAVVSGALDLYLAPWCRRHGLELLCSRVEVADGVLTGRYDGAQCAGEEKARRVRERYDLDAFGTVHAYGDTAEDRAMLALAHRRHFRWRELATELG